MFTPLFVIATLVEFLRSIMMLNVYSMPAIDITLFSCMVFEVFVRF